MRNFFIIASLITLAACAPQPTPTPAEVAREVTRVAEVTREVERDVIQTQLVTVEVTRIVEKIVTQTFTPTPQFTPTITPTPTETPLPSKTPTITLTPNVARTQTAVAFAKITQAFGDGFYLVNVDIAPGVWRSESGHDGCYWARTSITGDIRDNHFGLSGGTANIRANDFQFETRDCGTWTYLSP